MTTDPTQKLLVSWLDAAALRHRVICNNLANSETPGFVRKTVSFDAQLAQATSQSASITDDRSTPPRLDGNNIQVDQELAALSQNALMQQMAVQLLQAKFSMNKIAATGKT